MSRLLFVKEGVAVWSSHLDLMRALMRSFRRAGIDLKHSQGFTPHPELSILMPLSVGVESQCEIAEFTLAEGCDVPVLEIAARMNPVLPAGIRALESYEGGTKAGKLAWLRARLVLTYDASGKAFPLGGRRPRAHTGAGEGGSDESPVTSHQLPGDGEERILRSPFDFAQCKAENDRIEAIRALFARPSLVVQKHSKKGDAEMDIAPMIREIHVGTGTACPPSSVVLEAVVAAQNPTLNPLLLVTAMEKYLPECKPDHVVCRRLEIYDAEMNVFR